jgi:RIO kinase 1
VSSSLLADRAAPEWLIEESFEDRTVGVLMSGKEAEVFLVERRGESSSCFLAHKRFRPRHPRQGELRELGFSKGTIFRHDVSYRRGWHMASRERRAVETHTSFGQEVVAQLWPVNELEMLRRAWDAAASVPYPVGPSDDGILMEYIGDETQAAPRVVDARLEPGQLHEAWAQLVESLRRLTRESVVHGDLSVYNILWWRDRVVIIDFPQAVDARTNPEAASLLHRDVENVATWFGRRGVRVDAGRLFGELVGDLY